MLTQIMTNNYFLKQKFTEKSDVTYVVQTSLVSGLIENRQILISTLLLHSVL